MPRKKITLEQAFQAFKDHGLEVEVKGIDSGDNTPALQLQDFIDKEMLQESPVVAEPLDRSKTMVIKLYAAHSISCGGFITEVNGEKAVRDMSVETYGPGGKVRVPVYLASQLLHQDALARQADDNLHDRLFRQRVIMEIGSPSSPNGTSSVARLVDNGRNDQPLDLSALLAKLSDEQTGGIVL